jgi:hypothetical protein
VAKIWFELRWMAPDGTTREARHKTLRAAMRRALRTPKGSDPEVYVCRIVNDKSAKPAHHGETRTGLRR